MSFTRRLLEKPIIFEGNIMSTFTITKNLCIASLIICCLSFIPTAYSKGHDRVGHKQPVIAAKSLVGFDVNFIIEEAKTSLGSGYPTQGVVVTHYKKDGSWTAEGAGDKNLQNYHGTYKYRRTGVNTAIEKSIDISLQNAPLTTHYTFDTPMSGKWIQSFNNDQIIFSGSFTLIPSDLPQEQHTAPVSNTGLNIALFLKDAASTTLPANVYPKTGLALQTYATDGSFLIKGFGPKMLNSTGTYSFKKVSANTAVEKVIQVSELFTLPYTMVYTFETPTSGKWFQNLGNGFIKFHGTFESFPN